VGKRERLEATGAGNADDPDAHAARSGFANAGDTPNAEAAALRDPAEQESILAQPAQLDYDLHLEDDEFERVTLGADPSLTRANVEAFKASGWAWNDEKKRWLRKILLPLHLSHNQAVRLRVLDMVEQFTASALLEISNFTPDGRMPSPAWWTENPGYVDIAMKSPNVRRLARTLIATVAGVGMLEIEVGMTGAEAAACGLLYVNSINQELKARKKGSAGAATPAVPESAGASSSRPSSPPTRRSTAATSKRS
jgi:hypothetical protein